MGKNKKRAPATGKQFFSAGEKRRNPAVVQIYQTDADDFKDNGRNIAGGLSNNSRHVGPVDGYKRQVKAFREDDYGGRYVSQPEEYEEEYLGFAYDYDEPSEDEYDFESERWR